MATISSYSVEDVSRLRTRMEDALAESPCFQRSAQRFAELLFEAFFDSAVLFRVFATVAYGALPEKEQRFVVELARERKCESEIDESTAIIVLVGTRGRSPGWNDRYRSQRHLAIPLTRTSFIKTIPMVSRLMSDMGTGLEWVEKQKTNIVVSTTGRMAKVLYIEDARSALTNDGFKVVPDQEFVAAHGVRSVLGLGGAYLDGTVVTVILFTSELVPSGAVGKLKPLIHGFKSSTMKTVMKRRLFD